MIKVAPCRLTVHEQDFINNDIFGLRFPWYRVPYSTTEDVDPRVRGRCYNVPFFSHILMERSGNPSFDGTIISTAFHPFQQIFDRWMRTNSIDYTRIFRASVNWTVGNEIADHSVPHFDHTFAHKNWIMYLNTVDNAPTIMFDSEYNIVDRIPCIANTAATFENQLHAVGFHTGVEQRMVVVITYY